MVAQPVVDPDGDLHLHHELPWEHIGCDLMDFNGSDYLVISDYYSHWIEIDKVTSTTYAVIIENLLAHLSREDLQQKIRTDNDPRFMSERFQLFLKSMNI